MDGVDGRRGSRARRGSGRSEGAVLAARWRYLVGQFTSGDPEISSGLRKLYADQGNWPGDFKEQMQPFLKKEVWEFIGKAMACGK